MSNPKAAVLIIGDEILSGRTRDSNTYFLAGELTKIGIDLKEVRVVSDHAPSIVAAVNALRDQYDIVFTSGGIGPTHDDITADCIAASFGKRIGIRDDARAILKDRYDAMGTELNESRLRMARIRESASLIENPVSGAPGFKIGNVHVLAGVPAVFEAMVASVLPTLDAGSPLLSQTYRVDQAEGDIAAPLEAIATEFPDLSIGSYPFQQNGSYGSNIVVRGRDGSRVDAAMMRLSDMFSGDSR